MGREGEGKEWEGKGKLGEGMGREGEAKEWEGKGRGRKVPAR